MSVVTRLTCVRCGACYLPDGPWTCPVCGPDDGILDIHYDPDRAKKTLTRAGLAGRPLTHWRYAELLPIDDAFIPTGASRAASLESSAGAPAAAPARQQSRPPDSGRARAFDSTAGGGCAPFFIGWTPILEAPRLAAALGVARLRLKDEGRNASGSFKDRASSVGVAHAIQLGRREIACASTGNAASSLAHCAASAGLRCSIFVPQHVPEGKLAQLLACGARVFRVAGSYAQAYELCTRACERFGWYNRNCAINPYLVEGKKTGGLEVAEQCADDPPDWVAVSVGDGCTIAGIQKGLRQMKELGLIDWRPRILGVQAAGVAPIADAWSRVIAGQSLERITSRELSSRDTTYADSINCPVPRNWRKAVRAVHDSDGAFVVVGDEQIMEAVRLTGRLAGVFAEPAAAAAVAAVAEARKRGIMSERADVVVIVTANGLKDVAGALRAIGRPHDVKPDVDAVEKVVDSD